MVAEVNYKVKKKLLHATQKKIIKKNSEHVEIGKQSSLKKKWK